MGGFAFIHVFGAVRVGGSIFRVFPCDVIRYYVFRLGLVGTVDFRCFCGILVVILFCGGIGVVVNS